MEGKKSWRYGWIELGGRWVMLYQFGPYFARRVLNTYLQRGFLDCRKKNPFLFVFQTGAVPFLRL